MGVYAKGIILVLVLLFLVTFGVENSQPSKIKYYFESLTFDLPLYGLVYACIIIGVLTGMAVGFRNRLSLRKDIKNREAEIRKLRERITEEKEGEPSSE